MFDLDLLEDLDTRLADVTQRCGTEAKPQPAARNVEAPKQAAPKCPMAHLHGASA